MRNYHLRRKLYLSHRDRHESRDGKKKQFMKTSESSSYTFYRNLKRKKTKNKMSSGYTFIEKTNKLQETI